MRLSVLAKTICVLEEKLGFESVSFGLLKEIHTETRKEVKDGQIVPAHFIFPLYVDLLVDNIPHKFIDVFKFHPADEPLLRFVFEREEYREELEQFDKKLWLPSVALLLATKINCVQDRDKEHKKIKDLCDMFSLLWYTKEKPEDLHHKIPKFIAPDKIRKSLSVITKADYEQASGHVNHSAQEIKTVMALL